MTFQSSGNLRSQQIHRSIVGEARPNHANGSAAHAPPGAAWLSLRLRLQNTVVRNEGKLPSFAKFPRDICYKFVVGNRFNRMLAARNPQVDHFGYANNDTFKMRVLYNDDHYDVSNPGPIFFYTGNEGNIEMFANNTGKDSTARGSDEQKKFVPLLSRTRELEAAIVRALAILQDLCGTGHPTLRPC